MTTDSMEASPPAERPISCALGARPVQAPGETRRSRAGPGRSTERPAPAQDLGPARRAGDGDRRAGRPPPASERYLTAGQVADSLGVSTRTVHRWTEKGLLHGTRTVGGHRRYRWGDVERDMAAVRGWPGRRGEAAYEEDVARGPDDVPGERPAPSERDRLEEEVATYDQVVARFGDCSEAALREWVVTALMDKADTLRELSRWEEALAVYEDVLARFGDDPGPEVRVDVAGAMLNKGALLGDLGRWGEELPVCDEVVARFGEAPEAEMRETVARAMYNKGVALSQVDRAQAIAAYDVVVARFGDAPEAALSVALALVNMGNRLGDLDRPEEAIAAYDDVGVRLGEASEPELREWVCAALLNKAVTLGNLDRSLEAIATYDDVLARFGDQSDGQSEEVAQALLNKGVRLGVLDRSEEAMAAYDELVARFGQAPEPDLRRSVAKALLNTGIALAKRGVTEAATGAL